MKSTLIQEAPIYTIEVNGQKVTGMRQDGTLGPVRRFKNDKGEQVFVLKDDGLASTMRDIIGLGMSPDDVSVIAVSAGLFDRLKPKISDETLLQMALGALENHAERTGPIQRTTETIAALRARLGKTIEAEERHHLWDGSPAPNYKVTRGCAK